jgi:hypothetical protein
MPMRAYVAIAVLAVCGLVQPASRAEAQSANDQREPLRDVVSRLQREAQSRLRTKPKVVCGTTVIPAQPAVDPKSILKTPEGRKFTMRAVRPQMCGDNAQTADTAPQPEPPAPDVQPAR